MKMQKATTKRYRTHLMTSRRARSRGQLRQHDIIVRIYIIVAYIQRSKRHVLLQRILDHFCLGIPQLIVGEIQRCNLAVWVLQQPPRVRTAWLAREFALMFSSCSDPFSRRPSSSMRPPSSVSRFRRKFNSMRDSFRRRARPRYLPPSAWI